MILNIPVKYDKPIEAYIDYLKRATRTTAVSLSDEHAKLLSKNIAKSYGVTDKQLTKVVPDMLKRLDEDESLRRDAD